MNLALAWTRDALIRDAKARQLMSSAELAAVWKLMTHAPMTGAERLDATTGLKKLRAANGGAPTNAEILHMQELEDQLRNKGDRLL